MATVLPFDAAGIHLDPAQGLARQLYAALRERILDGRLGSRTRMPASRELAQALKVSRNTVVRAYEQLHAEGYIDGRTGDGTYVAELQEIPGRAPAVAPSAPAPRGPAALAPPPEGAPRAFRVGVPAFDLFPFDTWARLQARFWRNPPADCLGYGDPAGEARLRELIAAYLRSARGLRCEAEQVIVTHGAQQAIRLCAQVLLENGDPVAVENPGYRAARWPSPRPARYRTGSTSTPRAAQRPARGHCRLPPGLCHAVTPVPHRRHPVAGAAPGAAGMGRARRRLDRRGRLRRRVSLQRYAAGAAGRAGPTGPGALRRDLLQDRLPGVAPGLPGGPAGAGRALPPAAGHRVRHSEVGTQRVMADFIAEGISSATSAACAAPPAPAATPCCGAGQRRRVASRCRRWRRGCTCACGSTAWRGSGP